MEVIGNLGEGRGEVHHWVCLGAGSDTSFPDIVEVREKLEELFLRDWIVFVIVATCTAGGEAEPDGGSGFDAVDNVFDVELGREGSAFGILAVVAVEGGGEELGLAWVWQHVTGDLLDGELVKRHVVTESLDDPVTPGPVGAPTVVLIAVGIGVAGGIEPEESHALGVGVGG